MITAKKRFEVLKRDGFRCQYCGRNGKDITLEIDHITPKKLGGKDYLDNLTTACRECNIGKGDTEISNIKTYSEEELKKEYINKLKGMIYDERNNQCLGSIDKSTQVLIAIYISTFIEGRGHMETIEEVEESYNQFIEQEFEYFIGMMEYVSDNDNWTPANNYDKDRFGKRLNYLLTKDLNDVLKNKSVLYIHSINKELIS